MSPSETNTSFRALCQQQKPRQFLFFLFLEPSSPGGAACLQLEEKQIGFNERRRGLSAGGARHRQVEQSLQAHEVSDLVSRLVQARIWQPAGNCALETAPSWSKPWEGLKEASLHLPVILVLKSLRNCFAAFLFCLDVYGYGEGVRVGQA